MADGAAGIEGRIELGIDTASAAPSVAVFAGERLLAERCWTLETTISRELLAAIDAVLHEARVARDRIGAIAVDAGPGGYTGLRAGVATAQGLALALDAPLAAVSRLEADAFPQLAAGRPVVAVHDAGRERVAWGVYAAARSPGSAPVTLVEPRIDGYGDCARDAPAGALWCGELTPALLAAREQAGREGDADAAPPEGTRAASIVRLARLHGAYADPERVDVVYLRPPPITSPRPRGP